MGKLNNCYKIPRCNRNEEILLDTITTCHAYNCGYTLQAFKGCWVLTLNYLADDPEFTKDIQRLAEVSEKAWRFVPKKEVL